MTTIQVTSETLQALRLHKIHNQHKSYDQSISYLLKEKNHD